MRPFGTSFRLRFAAPPIAVLLLVFAQSPGLAQERPAAEFGPLHDAEWSIGLRGAYSSSSATGGEADAIVAPAFTLRREGERGETTLSGHGEFSMDASGAVRTDELRLGAGTTYALDAGGELAGSAELALTQPSLSDSSLPSGTMIAPLEFTGTATGSATRRFGQLALTSTLTGERYIEGPTKLTDGSSVDNSDQSYWLGKAGLRVGYELSPLLTVFAEGTEAYQAFDAPSPGLGVLLNGRTSELRGGLSYALEGTLSAEISAGRAWYDYDNPAVTDVPGWVADASVTFTPDETLSLTGALGSSIGPSDAVAGDTDIGYTLTGEGRYQVNPWLTLRSSASWDRTTTVGSGDVAWGYSAGIGLDLATTQHTVWTADYLFAHDVPATDPASDTHTVTVGVTIKR